MQTGPIVIIIFGATGDLMHAKLMPALYSLISKGAISDQTFIIGVGRKPLSHDDFVQLMKTSLEDHGITDINETSWKSISSQTRYVQGTFDEKELYKKITQELTQIDSTIKACVPRFFYLATPPIHYETILTNLEESSLATGCGHGTSLYTRLLIEKPFGKDLATAKQLEHLLSTIFQERQIYRIDHYLGKETIQNIMAFRFANGLFEPTWNHNFIDHVQITLAESLGVGTRGDFYDGIGALRDVVQNHMLEMLALIAMDQPFAFDAQSIRDEKVKMLGAIKMLSETDQQTSIIRGQYIGYVQEKNVDQNSKTETFVALKLLLESPRWHGVPFYLRTGKKLKNKYTKISIHYKKPIVCTGEVCLFPEHKVQQNSLELLIDPTENIIVHLMAKQPGFGMNLAPIDLSFSYEKSFKDKSNTTQAYEKLLLDSITGDQTLFARTDGIDASWKFVTPILNLWSQSDQKPIPYEPGTWGPTEADALIQNDNRSWS